jgi:hypothetical protein
MISLRVLSHAIHCAHMFQAARAILPHHQHRGFFESFHSATFACVQYCSYIRSNLLSLSLLRCSKRHKEQIRETKKYNAHYQEEK